MKTQEIRELVEKYPQIQDSVKNLTRQGRRLEDIIKIVGVPSEVAQKYMHEVREERR